MTRSLVLCAALLLAGCSSFKGSPHGYAGTGSGSVVGISIGMDPASGTPSVTLGSREGRFAIFPLLDGSGKPIDPAPSILTCFETEARTGARVVSRMAVGAAASEGC